MGKMGSSILVIIATLAFDGNAGARLPEGAVRADGGAARPARQVKARGARRTRKQRRHEAAPAPNPVPRRRASPEDLPAHLAPQPEDIPPVKPPKRTPPPADKRNPVR